MTHADQHTDTLHDTPLRRRPSADRKRELIIKAAERLFASRDFLQTTIGGISQESGVPEASIHHTTLRAVRLVSQAYKNTDGFWSLIRTTVEKGSDQGVLRPNFKTDYYLHLVQGTFEHEAPARMMISKKAATVISTERMIQLLLKAIHP